jgi:hypothetical protein
MLQIGPTSDIHLCCPYELACHFVRVEVFWTAGAIVKHRINKHSTLYKALCVFFSVCKICTLSSSPKDKRILDVHTLLHLIDSAKI